MAHLKLDRVAGTTASTGVGALTLDATAVDGYSRFQDVASDGDTAYVMVVDRTTKVRQGGIYTYSAGALTLTTLLSSTTGSQINFGAGTKDLFNYDPASKALVEDPNGDVSITGSLVVAGSVTAPLLNALDTLAALKALTTRPESVLVKGKTTANDGWGGVFAWVAGDTTTADDALVVQPTSGAAGRYKRLYDGGMDVRWFGVLNDGTAQTADAINAAITASAAGKGIVRFPAGTYLVTTSILALAGAVIEGPGDIAGLAGAAVLKVGANLTAFITTSNNNATNIHSFIMRGLTIDGNKGTYTCGDLVILGLLNGTIENCYITNGSGNGVHVVPGTNPTTDPAWIFKIRGGTVGSCAGVGIIAESSDSSIIGTYVSGNTTGNILIKTGSGAIRVIGCQIEVSAGYGLKCITPDATAGIPQTSNMIVGNLFDQNDTAIWFSKGVAGTDAECWTVVDANKFGNSTTQDILIDSHLLDGTIGDANDFNNSDPATAHIVWGGTSNTGWKVGGSFRKIGVARFSNPPSDAQGITGGVGGVYNVIGGGNITGDLLFTDATYDIGKSGTTRPRDGFFSRSLVADTSVTSGQVEATGVNGFILGPWNISLSVGNIVFYTGGNKAVIDTSGNVTAEGAFKVGANQVIGARDTGWTAMTGSSNKATAYDTSTVTTAQLAGRVMALQTALTTHGLIGA
jgi:hypothetical protein